METLARLFEQYHALCVRFRRDERGSILILFAFAGVVLVAIVGAAMDLSRAYSARQRLSETANLACQYAARSSVNSTVASNPSSSNITGYKTSVTNFVTQALGTQKFGWTQTNATPFSWSSGNAGNIALSANVPMTFMKLFTVSQITVGANAHCFDTIAAISQPVSSTSGAVVAQEGFETSGCSGACWYFYAPGATPGNTRSTPLNTFPATSTYTSASGVHWYVMGYCVEIDAINTIFSSAPQGSHSTELDCDNGSGAAGNSSISAQVYLDVGTYELRWNYAARVDYPDYDPVYICGNQGNDVNWANSTNSSGGPVANALRTNQINVYLDYSSSSSSYANGGSAPPTHTTIVDSETLAGSNLIDMCVYSNGWIQRSVKITTYQKGYYWLSFAADGQNDSYGGSIDNLILCVTACTGSVQDNFPGAWQAANNGGVNPTLFQDKFESPVYSGSNYNNSGNLNNSNASLSGWPDASSSGWMVAPYNQATYIRSGAGQGAQSVQLDGWNNGSMTTTNRAMKSAFPACSGLLSALVPL